MRLVNTRSLQFHDFYLSEVPQYAILSHTWGDDEVSFQDMSLPDRSSRKGYAKIIQTCQLALQHGLDFAWVDTCCIDKSSSAELTESINSMFHWYTNAAVCYVYLEDLPPDNSTEGGLTKCRWFTRGWTLQELLAPKFVQLYDMAWNYIGTKLHYINAISNATGIPRNVIRGDASLANYSVARRMSWAARRQTTRVEDTAYCLLGIFDVNMPLLYGEGPKAFRRLQEEIVKRNNDLTIFAWDNLNRHEHQFLGLFAPSPAGFINSSGVSPFIDDFINFSVTNKGLFVSGDVPLRTASITTEDGLQIVRYMIFLGLYSSTFDGGIYLRKIGPKLFQRDGKLAGFGLNDVNQIHVFDTTDYYILIDPITSGGISSSTFRNCALHVPFDPIFELDNPVPRTLWDITDRTFLRPKPYHGTRYPMVLAMRFFGRLEGALVYLVVLCDYRGPVPVGKVFRPGQYPRQETIIFRARNRNESVYWEELEIEEPGFLLLGNYADVVVGNQGFRISVLFEKRIVESIAKDVSLFSLKLDISKAG
jgi:hypothetical protein